MSEPAIPADVVLGLPAHLRPNVPEADQVRQRREVIEILRRLERQPGVILADEVGMGKTFVALATAVSVALRDSGGPVVVMIPSTLEAKWRQDLHTFCELYAPALECVRIGDEGVEPRRLRRPGVVRYAAVRDGTAFLKLLDDPRPERAQIAFVTHGTMSRQRMDRWVNLCLVAEALRRHGRGTNRRLIEVKRVIHRFLGRLVGMTGREQRHDLGEELWQRLLRASPLAWREIHDGDLRNESQHLVDDPVPKAVVHALPRLDLRPLAEALRRMPIRAVGGDDRVDERIAAVRAELHGIERRLWAEVLRGSRWRSPLLVMDEAHHLKNAETRLARQLQSPDSIADLKAGDGALAGKFDRMLFLTATPFQLGHRELVSVLRRCGDVRWDAARLGPQAAFQAALDALGNDLDEAQRASIAMQRAWSRMRPGDVAAPGEDAGAWWRRIDRAPADGLTAHQRAFRDACRAAAEKRRRANALLRPWVLRHNKGAAWADTRIARRERAEGAAIVAAEPGGTAGIAIPDDQLLPFFLAARAAANPHKDLLGEALCSSYEAFQFTRRDRSHPQDHDDHLPPDEAERRRRRAELDEALANAWYLDQLETALGDRTDARSRRVHPKMAATVRRVADLWERGEKVVVFAFYRHTCTALRRHIGDEIRRRLLARARERLGLADDVGDARVWQHLDRLQEAFFGRRKSPRPGQRALDEALAAILDEHAAVIRPIDPDGRVRATLLGVMQRFLRVESSLVRCFPLDRDVSRDHADLVRAFLDHRDGSGMSWRNKFTAFILFLATRCGEEERAGMLAAVDTIATGDHAAADDDHADAPESDGTILANVGVCSGGTRMEVRVRRMRAFNTPFFPDVLVCSEVMGEGVDLHRFCRHVIHHDLAWNPSDIEQRTGRIDRLGCKAEGRHPIVSYLPYLGGAADERQFLVMRDRERWFQVVMGQEAVAELITADTVEASAPVPDALVESLAFDLSLAEGTG